MNPLRDVQVVHKVAAPDDQYTLVAQGESLFALQEAPEVTVEVVQNTFIAVAASDRASPSNRRR